MGLVYAANAVPPTGDDLSIMEAQAPLIAAATELNSLVDTGADRGFAGIELARPDEKGVTLYWNGPLPQDVNALVEKLRAQVGIAVVHAG